MQVTVHDQILRPRKRKWAGMLAGGGAFVGAGFWMVNGADSSSERSLGYVCMLFFGLGVVVSLLQLIPGSSYLRLARDGIIIRSMWRTTFYRWSDIERFGVG